MLSKLAGFIYYKLLGWKSEGSFPKDVKKYVIAVAPHTSNWDLLFGILQRMYAKMPAWFIAKNSLFWFPLNIVMRALGGYPVDRSKSSNYVDSVVEIFSHKEEFNVTIAPEGTRGKVDKLKSGFYYIAVGAKIPIVIVTLDWGNKIVKFSEPFWPTGNKEADMEFILNHWRGVKGKNPENSIYF